MIEAIELTKRYGHVPAIDGVSFTVNPGEIVGFLGPNGSGKSTTMRILTGFSPASSGRAIVAGRDVRTDSLGVRRNVGYLPENVPLYGEMRVNRFLRYVTEVKGVARRQCRAEVGRVIERCGLTEMSNRVIGHLSRGYRQRVGLAQALIGDPPVLIFDEPTVGLDPRQIIGIREMIRELAGEHTVLLSTHVLQEVALVCDRAIIISNGRIVSEQNIRELGSREGALEEAFMKAVGTQTDAELAE